MFDRESEIICVELKINIGHVLWFKVEELEATRGRGVKIRWLGRS